MRIAWSCNGEGRGHGARFVALYTALASRHEIVPFMPASLDAFYEEKLPGLATYPIPHFTLAKVGDRIDYAATLGENKTKILLFPIHVRAVARRLLRAGAQVVVSDFEPYLPAAAHLLDIPVLQINHPGVICRFAHQSFSAYSSRWVARKMMGPHERRVICSFYNGTVGPIIRPEITTARVKKGDYFVVYLRGSYGPLVLRHLERMRSHGRPLKYKVFPSKTMDFVTELAGSKGVIANAGHQLMCESVYLKKPMFVLPQGGQYEQWLNASMLEQAGWGVHGSMANFDEALPRFIEEADAYPRQAAPGFAESVDLNFENDLEATAELIDRWVSRHGGSPRPR